MPTNETLLNHVKGHPALHEILRRADEVKLSSWAFGAGCVAQTVWNHLSSREPSYGIQDIDLVYFDSTDTSFEAEDAVIHRLTTLFADLPLKLDIKNQARVHLWYEQKHGYPIEPYRNLEDAIGTWPTTSNCVAIFPSEGERVYAAYGLEDLFNRVVRPNKRQITESIYLRKVARWRELWPELTITPW